MVQIPSEQALGALGVVMPVLLVYKRCLFYIANRPMMAHDFEPPYAEVVQSNRGGCDSRVYIIGIPSER